MIARVLKWLLHGVLALLCLLLLAWGALSLVINTERGTRWALGFIDGRIAGELTVEKVSGTLWRGIKADQASYRDDTLELVAKDLELVIDWPFLLSGELHIDRVVAASLRYQSLTAAPAEPQPFTLAFSPLPVRVAVDAARIDSIIVAGADGDTLISNAVLQTANISDQRIRAASAAATIGTISFAASQLDTTLTGDVPLSANLRWSFGDEWSGRGSVRGTLAELQVAQDVQGQWPATIRGSVALLNRIEPAVDVRVEWQSWQFGDYRIANGTATVSGTTDDYALSYQVDASLPLPAEARIEGSAEGNTEGLRSLNAVLASDYGTVNVDGGLSWAPDLTFAGDIAASGFDPSLIVAALPGELAANAHVELEPGGRIIVSDADIEGTLRDEPIKATGSARIDGDDLQCEQCVVVIDRNRVEVDGSYSPDNIDVSLVIDAPNLAVLWPGLGGSLHGDGKLAGTLLTPRFTGEMRGSRLQLAPCTLDSLDVRGAGDTASAFSVTTELSGITCNEQALGNLLADAHGTIEALDFDLDWQSPWGRLVTAGNAQQPDDRIRVVLSQATFAEPNTGTWTLQQALTVGLEGSDIEVDAHEWRNGESALRVSSLQSAANRTTLVAAIDRLPLALANPLLPANLALRGTATAAVDLSREGDAWRGTLDWQQDGTVLTVTEANNEKTEVVIPRAEAHAAAGAEGLALNAGLAVEPGVTAEVMVTLDRLASDAQLTGELKLRGSEWDWIPALLPDIDKFEGDISAQLSAQGVASAPSLSGSLDWKNGSLMVPSVNVPISEIDISLQGASEGSATLRGSARAGDGSLTIDGEFRGLMQPERSAVFTLGGSAAELINWPEYHVWASPNLVVRADQSGWTVSGDLTVPRAEIEIVEIPEETVTPSADVKVIGREAEPEVPTRYSGEARLTLGKRVHIRAFGLDTGLEGSLLLKQPQNRPLAAEGQLTLTDGVFSAYGQRLKIEQGTLTFTGPLDDPIVDVRAVRTIETLSGTVKAGIHLQGRALNLGSSVYSEPQMAEADALSYLMIGRPLNQASSSEGSELSNAAVALGMRQASRITEQIGQALGLDQLSLTGNGGDNAALVAGKQLNSRMYVRYAYSVFSRIGTLLLRYRLSQRLTLEAGAGEAHSIDLLYSVEKP